MRLLFPTATPTATSSPTSWAFVKMTTSPQSESWPGARAGVFRPLEADDRSVRAELKARWKSRELVTKDENKRPWLIAQGS